MTLADVGFQALIGTARTRGTTDFANLDELCFKPS